MFCVCSKTGLRPNHNGISDLGKNIKVVLYTTYFLKFISNYITPCLKLSSDISFPLTIAFIWDPQNCVRYKMSPTFIVSCFVLSRCFRLCLSLCLTKPFANSALSQFQKLGCFSPSCLLSQQHVTYFNHPHSQSVTLPIPHLIYFCQRNDYNKHLPCLIIC